MNSTKYARRSRSTSVCVNRTTSASIYGLTLTGQDRLQWTQRSQRWLQGQWAEVLFRDKSRFHLRGNDGSIRTWRRRSEWYANCCVREAERWAGGSVMVWGGFSFRNCTPLIDNDGSITAQRYISDALRTTVVPFCAVHRDVTYFQQD